MDDNIYLRRGSKWTLISTQERFVYHEYYVFHKKKLFEGHISNSSGIGGIQIFYPLFLTPIREGCVPHLTSEQTIAYLLLKKIADQKFRQQSETLSKKELLFRQITVETNGLTLISKKTLGSQLQDRCVNNV